MWKWFERAEQSRANTVHEKIDAGAGRCHVLEKRIARASLSPLRAFMTVPARHTAQFQKAAITFV
jgi:hypothetical protein